MKRKDYATFWVRLPGDPPLWLRGYDTSKPGFEVAVGTGSTRQAKRFYVPAAAAAVAHRHGGTVEEATE